MTNFSLEVVNPLVLLCGFLLYGGLPPSVLPLIGRANVPSGQEPEQPAREKATVLVGYFK